MTSLTVENYVKAIYQICVHQEQTPATTGALAAALRLSPAAVTCMLKTLSESGLVVYTPYEGVRLTPSGRALALRILRRHRLIELFLSRTLGLSWDEVHEEAEHMEHAVSDRLVDRIDAHLGFPDADPHGDPIPRADGTVATADGRCLSGWDADSPFRLVRVLDQSPEFLRFLSAAGLDLGVEGRIHSRRPEAGTLEVVVAATHTTLSLDAAAKLWVTAGHGE